MASKNLSDSPTPTPAYIAASNVIGTAGRADATTELPQVGEGKHLRRKRHTGVKIAIVVIVVMLCGMGACTWVVADQVNKATENTSVPTMTLEKGSFTNDVTASGKLAPAQLVSATSSVDGIVESVNVSEGSAVNEGDVLFTVANSDLDRAVESAEQTVKEAENGVSTAELAVQSARNTYNAGAEAQQAACDAENERVSKYNAAVAAGQDPSAYATAIDTNTFDADSANNQIEQAKLQLSSANITLENAQQALSLAEEKRDKREVRASLTGSVIAVNIEPGQSLSTLSASGKSPVQIADLSSMTVEVQVNEMDIVSVAVGQQVNLTFSAVPGLQASGEVIRIASTSTGTGTTSSSTGVVSYGVEVVLKNPDARLKVGMTARASIVTEQLEGVLVVPRTALTGFTGEKGSNATVTLVGEDGTAGETVAVTVVTSNTTEAVIEGGVRAGDTIQSSNASGSTGSSSTSTSTAGTVTVS